MGVNKLRNLIKKTKKRKKFIKQKLKTTTRNSSFNARKKSRIINLFNSKNDKKLKLY